MSCKTVDLLNIRRPAWSEAFDVEDVIMCTMESINVSVNF